MAKRVFDTLGQWTTLDDAALDAADPRAPASTARRCAMRGATVRLRAGDAGRAEGADHPRALHAPAASVSIRGQCSGALHVLEDRAQAEMIDRCHSECCWKRPPTPIARSGARCRRDHGGAADVTFKDVIREAIAERDHSWRGRPRRHRAYLRRTVRTLGIDPDDRLGGCRARDRRRTEPARHAMAGGRPGLNTGRNPIRNSGKLCGCGSTGDDGAGR